jgi:hypothetical protein
MAANQRSRILRTYRNANSPARFHSLNQKICKGLTDNKTIPASAFSGNPTLLPSYFAVSKKHDDVYHQAALYSSKLDIAERELLQAQIIEYLDEIAMILEGVAFYNPTILLTSGFELAKERRSHPRTKVPQVDSEEVKASEQQPSS